MCSRSAARMESGIGRILLRSHIAEIHIFSFLRLSSHIALRKLLRSTRMRFLERRARAVADYPSRQDRSTSRNRMRQRKLHLYNGPPKANVRFGMFSAAMLAASCQSQCPKMS